MDSVATPDNDVSREWGFRTKLWIGRILIRGLGALPVSVRRLIGRTLGFVFAMIPTRERRIAKLQLSVAFGDERASSLLPGVYQHIFQTALESLNLSPILARPELITCDEAALDFYRNRTTGLLALTAHTPNWDLLAAYMIRNGLPMSVVGRQARNPVFQKLLEGIRERYGVKTIWRSGKSGVREIVDALANRELLAALVDQDTKVRSLSVPFFGLSARTPVTLVEIAKSNGCQIVSCFIFREKGGRYAIKLEGIDPALPVDEILAIYNKRLETYLLDYPSQWVWFHKRWRSAAADDRPSSGRYIEFLEHYILARRNRREMTDGSSVATTNRGEMT